LDAEHANPTFDGNAAPTEPRVRLWFGKGWLVVERQVRIDSDHRVTVNGELRVYGRSWPIAAISRDEIIRIAGHDPSHPATRISLNNGSLAGILFVTVGACRRWPMATQPYCPMQRRSFVQRDVVALDFILRLVLARVMV
jgi:hypothetical protein